MISNLVQQKTTSTGTSAVTLAPLNGRQSFHQAFGAGGSDMFFYFISHATADEWEVGTGHMTDAVTLSRDTVIASSNLNESVDFTAGDKFVTNDLPAEYQITGPVTTATIDDYAGTTQQMINATPLANLAGDLPVTKLNRGTNATPKTFWRGDGVWAEPPSTPTPGQIFATSMNIGVF